MEYEKQKLKVALVHDYLQWHGGAEKVLEALHEIWPDAPVYTSVYNPDTMPDLYKSWDIRTSFMQKLPWWSKFLKHYSFLYPMAFEQFDFSEYDLVISSSAGFAKGIITRPETTHIAYTHTPPRFQWGYATATREKLNGFYTNWILPPIDNYLRIWDQCAAKRVDYFVCNSREVQKRIKKIYRQDSTVINPPVEFERFADHESKKENYFVTIGRLERYKNFDLLIKAFNKLGLDYKLKIIGGGSDEAYLRSLAHSNIEFMGRASDDDLTKLLCNAKAFIYAAEEDFGIVMAESLAAGTPIVAYGKAGALEIVEENKTGVFFKDLSEESIASAIHNFEKMEFDLEYCKKQAQRFSKERFKNEIKNFVSKLLQSRSKVDTNV